MAEESRDRVARIQEEWQRERPELDVSPQGVIGRLHRLAAALTGELTEVYSRFGLGEGEFDVLATLRRSGAPFERAPSELAEHTMVTTGAMSKRIDRLEAAGLVSRRAAEPVPGRTVDGRRRTVALTPEGLALIDDAFEAHMANEARLVAELSPADRVDLERILTGWLGRHEPR